MNKGKIIVLLKAMQLKICKILQHENIDVYVINDIMIVFNKIVNELKGRNSNNKHKEDEVK